MTTDATEPRPAAVDRTRYRFPRSRRLTRARDFRRVFAAKRAFIDEELIVRAASNDGRPARLGMAIGRKVGRAVRRNRIKRLIREAFRLNQHRFPDGLDVIVVPRKGARLTLESVSTSLCSLMARAAADPRVKRAAPQVTDGESEP